jgi:uncharacterized protein
VLLGNPAIGGRGVGRVSQVITAALGLGGLAVAWAVLVEPRLLAEEHLEVTLPNLTRAWKGQHIVLLADLQIGMGLGNTDTLRRAVARTIAVRPALVLLAGDFVYEAVRRPQPALDTLSSVLLPLTNAGLHAFAVLGNHDYGEEGTRRDRLLLAQRVRRTLEEIGIRVLENEAVAVTSRAAGEGPLFVVGIGPHIPQRDEPGCAIRQVPDDCPRVVFMHNPASFPELPAGLAPLALAGHTHGGQLRVPLVPSWSLGRLTVPWPEYLDGWIDDYGQPGNRLYVNRGLGFSRRPMRFGCPPELTLITLRCSS